MLRSATDRSSGELLHCPKTLACDADRIVPYVEHIQPGSR